MSKRFILALAFVLCFFIGFGTAAKAWPGVRDRNEFYGYFKNQFDSWGVDVLPEGLPDEVDSANEFIAFVKGKLNDTNDQYEVAASFIIATMLSDNAPNSYVRTLKPTAAQVADWESRVRAMDSKGLVDWKFEDYSYTENSMYQDDPPGTPKGDVTFYNNVGTSDVIAFKDPNNPGGAPIYIIRRECANPLSRPRGLPKAADFELRPVVTPNPATVQQGDQVTFTYTIVNDGTTVTSNINCSRVAADRPAGYTPLPQQDVARTPASAQAGCPTTINAKSTKQIATETVTVANQPPGGKVCRSLIVNPKDEVGGARTSAEACVTIAKAPYAHFMGNDVWSGGNFPDIAAACTGAGKIHTVARQLPDGTPAGSVGEYGVFALGTITSFGSASRPLINPSSSVGKAFSFANTGSAPGTFGASNHCINDYLLRFASNGLTSLPAAIDVGTRGSGVWRVSGNRTLHGTVPNGAQQVYIVQDGSLTIDGDVKYSGNYNGLQDIPSIVVITTCTTPSQCNDDNNSRGQILINNNVQQIDGLYVAKNIFNTCANVADPLNVSLCNQRLTVNGAVVAREMRLRRTFGADGATSTTRKQPAEIFNFTPEIYLRSALQRTSGTTIETFDMRELPPRF